MQLKISALIRRVYLELKNKVYKCSKMATVLYQMKDEEREGFSRQAAFLFLLSQGNKTVLKKKQWWKEVRPAWDRLSANKPRANDAKLKDLVFALNHRVCGSEDMVNM